ncbi:MULTISPECIES: 2-oxoglutarate dehydrogenase complex dihydrolipoyllysine-residue succinyltransferase [unclassified Arcicella]|uniref:2-oxoglutarate dehydrogenase complex dihydrolipoyllysine-residue succinyltransferase n=1 Tax=unclassified Arcicella TaxID=2644986 RepID=UPI00285C51FB|nr:MULTISPECIES: 2-oxoglutarate dehydrogenase complex dihydrolipoyllysine-residue succinyltransferase [unclassified Arcicella]MDR6560151.1 2-oxoglutarate dehydrogenase E2 component (dihydrolipoamide succinyltransferase) [Arcicella sp. BE51]MDR6810242.1 2-oxoglutarate dehydrogenase E2 component (dihydrolipoamide succinyltransferase) [Arcicella sp. BE140]MDR6821592.1 2-oxoglutarate dehydrogenase E2 component (dihydrolipoamide succinyltransferase) [Arcicella sp. BE139]
MAIEMKVPPVGESITEVTIAAWNKKDGDTVKMDEVLCELESDKATFELPAEAEGVLKIVAKEGDTLPIGAVICIIETVGGQVAPAPAEPAPATQEANAPAPSAPAQAPVANTEAPKTIEIKVPAVGESITEVTVSSWNKKEGDSVNMDEVLCELESDKATFELPAEATGTLHIVAEAGTTLPIGGIVATITIGAGQAVATSAPTAAPTAPEAPASSASATSYAAGHASPAAAKALAEKGIDPANVQGSGVGGRITKEDAQSAQKPVAVPTPAPAKASEPAPVAAPSTSGRGERTEKMTSLRKTVARRLVQVKNETAMLTTFNEVDMKPIMDLRGKYKDKFKEKHGVGLGFMSFFTKAVCVALKEFPAVNASIDGDSIVFHDYCDISIAVSAPKGLVVPVIRNAEQLSLAGIESEVIRLAVKARDNKLTLPEMTGGTFTITNGGVFGSMLSTPIINAPQSAILGMHNIVERAVVVGGQIVVRPIMYIALSYDHRIIDGRESVSFLVRVKQLLEDPTRLLLDV